MDQTKVALIGCGAWGKNYLRLLRHWGIRHEVVDPYSHEGTTTESQALGWCDAAIIATPAKTHAEIAKRFLDAGKHVLVEKPMATSVADAEMMIDMCRSVMMVSSPTLFGVQPDLSRSDVAVAHWCHNGGVREDVSVLWDMAPHPVAMVLNQIKELPSVVRTYGQNLGMVLICEWATFTLVVECSWRQQRRRILLTGQEIFDLDSIRHTKEPLAAQLGEFLSAITYERPPRLATAQQGLDVVKVLANAC